MEILETLRNAAPALVFTALIAALIIHVAVRCYCGYLEIRQTMWRDEAEAMMFGHWPEGQPGRHGQPGQTGMTSGGQPGEQAAADTHDPQPPQPALLTLALSKWAIYGLAAGILLGEALFSYRVDTLLAMLPGAAS